MIIEKVLIVEPDSANQQFLQELLRKKKSETVFADSGMLGRELLREHTFDLIICDLQCNGLEILKAAQKTHPQIIVIFTTATASVEQAVEAMQRGAFNYVLKPFNKDGIETLLKKVEEHLSRLRENQYLREEISTQKRRKKSILVAESEAMKKILSDVSKIAKSSSSVFISGESGTGKEMVAQAIHAESHRVSQPFIKVNCAAIPNSLLESEFFGHEKGSFTGAFNKRLGRFELADRGTLLLDEISEIPLELQSKLLRVVQEMEFERVGGTKPIEVDVRLISTSNRSMKEAIEQKTFREDLYYRLNVVPIHIPPLRERKEDILPLAEFFLNQLCSENQKPIKKLSEQAKQKLLEYHWPGNIRELANIIERTVVMHATETIEVHHLYIDLTCTYKPINLPSGLTLAELEKQLILETLARESHNRTKTAQLLGISLRTLRNKLNAYQGK